LHNLSRSCQESDQGLVKEKSSKVLGIPNWTQTCKRTSPPPSQKKKGAIKIKQKPATMGGRTIYRTLHLKGYLFKLGLTDNPICKRCQEKDESATHILCDCEARAYLRFSHLGQFLMEPNDYYGTPIHKVLHFTRSVGLIKG
jgi:hypothetical protein